MRTDLIDTCVKSHLGTTFPGVALAVYVGGRPVVRSVYGNRREHPVRARLNGDDLFDVASLTKPLATGLMTLVLMDQGAITLATTIGAVLPEAHASLHEVTVKHLLTHTAGVPAIPGLQHFFPDARAVDAVATTTHLLAIAQERPTGTEVVYSCTGFQLLGLMLQRITDSTLPILFRRLVAGPLGLPWAGFRPLAHHVPRPLPAVDRARGLDDSAAFGGTPASSADPATRATPASSSGPATGGPPALGGPPTLGGTSALGRLPALGGTSARGARDDDTGPDYTQPPHPPIAATEWCPWRRRWVHGEVHDEGAYCLAGNAGNAGLFATLDEVSTLARVWAGSNDVPLLTEETRRNAVRSHTDGMAQRRGLAVQVNDGDAAGGPALSDDSFGHTGFTGTHFWVDPERELTVVSLSSRLQYGRDETLEPIKRFRRDLHHALVTELDL